MMNMQWKEGFNMAEMITVKIDGTDITVPKGTTILEAARKIGVKIPTLCNHPDLRRAEIGRASCRERV